MLRVMLLTLILATPAAAHEPDTGPNGGARMDAGPYRVELVPAGTVVTVHITLDDDSAVDTAAMTGTAILLIDGQPVRVALVPAAPGTLSADTGVDVPSDVKGAVQILGSDGVTVQAKF
jgi:hypothetical protein